MRRILIATPLLAFIAAGCTGTGSYKSQTEDFINDDSTVADSVGSDLSDAACNEPDSTDIDTTYQCTATVEDGSTKTFDVLIDDEDSFLVTDFNPK